MMAAATLHLASADDVVARARTAWRPPPRLHLDEWADHYYYLSPDAGAAEPGRWHTLPYQRGIMRALSDPRIKQVTLMKSARVGYTNIILADIGRKMHTDPAPMLVIQPTLNDAKGFSKESIQPMLRDVPVLSDLFPPKAMRRNTLTLLRHPGGLLHLVGAQSPGSFRRVGRRDIYGDEVDGYPKSAGKEGNPILLAKRRSEYYWNAKWVWGSTPTISGVSEIERLYLEGDQRRFYVPCTQCRYVDYLVFRREAAAGNTAGRGLFMRWTPGAPADAHFVCPECGGVIEHKDKRRIIEDADRRQLAGETGIGWVGHAPLVDHASFHIWAAYGYSPNATWADIAKEFEEAKDGGRETLQTWVNTVAGETWKEAIETPDWKRLYERRETYTAACPFGVLFLTAGVDVQRDGIYYEVVGWGAKKRSWGIEEGFLPGDPADLDNGPWKQLDALLERRFRHTCGADLAIRRLAIDSGDGTLTNTIYTWARTYPMTRVMAIKGDDRVGMLFGSHSKVDVTISGRKVGYRMWRVSPYVAKSELYGWLRLQAPTAEARAAGAEDPPGHCRWPVTYTERYFKQLTGNELVPQRTASGFTLMVWVRPANKQDHGLDCRVYARVAAGAVGMDSWGDADWQQLAEAIGATAPPPSPTTPPAPAPAPAAPGQVPATKRFIEPRRGFIKKRG